MRGLGIFIMAALIIPVLFLSGCRTAETVPEEKPSDVTILYRLDKNGDANLSKEEWQGGGQGRGPPDYPPRKKP